jgi:hypothetical protein
MSSPGRDQSTKSTIQAHDLGIGCAFAYGAMLAAAGGIMMDGRWNMMAEWAGDGTVSPAHDVASDPWDRGARQVSVFQMKRKR